jgi:hypothetical protein
MGTGSYGGTSAFAALSIAHSIVATAVLGVSGQRNRTPAR